MPSNPSAIELGKAATYSHAPPQASFDVSNMVGRPDIPGVVPFSTVADNTDPLTGFMAQNDNRPRQTEADRIGADRFGMAFPMIRGQRVHSGDRHFSGAIARRVLAHTEIGRIFTPLEMPQDPRYLFKDSK